MRNLLVLLMLFSVASYSYAQGLLSGEAEQKNIKYVIIQKNVIEHQIQEGNIIDFNYKSRRNNKGQIELYAKHSSVSCGLYKGSETVISLEIHTYHSPLEDLDDLSGLNFLHDIADLSAEGHNEPNQEDIIYLYNSFEKQGKVKDGELFNLTKCLLHFGDENKKVLDINRNAQLFVHKQEGYLMDVYTLAIIIRINKEKDNYHYIQDIKEVSYIIPNGVRNILFMYEGKWYFIPLFEENSEIYDVGYQLSKMKWVAEIPEDYYQYVK